MKAPLDLLLDDREAERNPGSDFADAVSQRLARDRRRAHWLRIATVVVCVSTLFAVTGGLLAGAVHLIQGFGSVGVTLGLISMPVILGTVIAAFWIHSLTR